MQNRITSLFNIQYPLIQAGMIWCSGWELASAVSNAGGLGIIGSGSMYPSILEEHILKCKAATDKPFAVNLPMLYPNIEEHIALIIQHKVPIVFTSAGNPKTYTARLKEQGITVVHVVSSAKFAKKAQDAGVDAIVAEGFEAGGHNGKEETTTMTLIPAVRRACSLPLMAAGGIGSGDAMLAAMALGAEGVQIGSLFAVSEESSAHRDFKKLVLGLNEGDTKLALKKIGPVRLIKNEFFRIVNTMEQEGADAESLKAILGKGRAKLGMFEGDLEKGELEIGQVASIFREILPVETIMKNLIQEYRMAKERINTSPFEL